MSPSQYGEDIVIGNQKRRKRQQRLQKTLAIK